MTAGRLEGEFNNDGGIPMVTSKHGGLYWRAPPSDYIKYNLSGDEGSLVYTDRYVCGHDATQLHPKEFFYRIPIISSSR